MSGIGIAFGGGGARGLAHIGVLKALRNKTDLLPTMIAGTSVGSIVGTLYAAGIDQQILENEVQQFDWLHDVVSFHDTVKKLLKGRPGGLISNTKLIDTVNELLDNRSFEQLNYDLAVVATDIETRRRVIFTSPHVAERIDRDVLASFLPAPGTDKPGTETLIVSDHEDVGSAVAASCAVPGIFRPVMINGMKLVDGAVVDQVPVDVVKAMGAKPSIGVSLSFSVKPDKINSVASVFSSMIYMLGTQQLRKSLDMADIGFQIPGIDSRSVFDTKQFDLIDEGEKTMYRYMKKLERMSRRFSRK